MPSQKSYSPSDAANRYLPLMHELAIRIQLVADACDGRLNLLPPFAREYSYFQFRRMCELIALGALIIHGELPGTQTEKVKGEWNADRMMRILHNEHPNAFPEPVDVVRTAVGVQITANQKPKALTRGEFKQLYAECGLILHRGNIKRLDIEGAISNKYYDRVHIWQEKIVTLMNSHLMSRKGAPGFFIIHLKTENGYPECTICTKEGVGGLKVETINMTVNPYDPNNPKQDSTAQQLPYIIQSSPE